MQLICNLYMLVIFRLVKQHIHFTTATETFAQYVCWFIALFTKTANLFLYGERNKNSTLVYIGEIMMPRFLKSNRYYGFEENCGIEKLLWGMKLEKSAFGRNETGTECLLGGMKLEQNAPWEEWSWNKVPLGRNEVGTKCLLGGMKASRISQILHKISAQRDELSWLNFASANNWVFYFVKSIRYFSID